MNFDYSDDQKLIKGEARKFLAAHCPIGVTRSVLDNRDKPFDADLWKAVVDMGWPGAAIPEVWGGAGLGHVDLCAIAEELGRVVAPIPFASTVYLFAEAILAFGSTGQCDTYLRGVATGGIIGCLATTEGKRRQQVLAMDTVVREGRLSGTKIPVTDGDVASHAIVAAQTKNGSGLFIVDLRSEGVTRDRIATLDPTRSAARLKFDEVACESLALASNGDAALAAVLNRAAVLFAFEQVGGADRCLEDACAYARGRYAFGRVIGSYQAIKHKLADVYVKNEIARSTAYFGAWALSSGAPELPEAAAAARVAGTEAYDFAAKENLQTHGGMGFTWDIDCHLHLRRSRQLALELGAIPVWRDRLVDALEYRNAA